MGKIVIRPGTDRYLTTNIIDKNIDIIEKSNIIIFDLEIPLKTVAYAIDKCYEKKKIIILRPSFILGEKQDKLSEEQENIFGNLIKKVNYLIVDEYEFSLISGEAIISEEDVDKAFRRFMKKIKEKNKEIQNLILILKYGGCCLWNKDGDKKNFCPYYKTKDIVDFTGAVDCFIGVFAAFLYNKYKLDEAIKYANLAVSISVKKFGIIDTFPNLDEINKEKEKINW